MEGPLAIALSRLGREVARTLLPSWCVVCDGDLPWRDRVGSCCSRCWFALPRIEGRTCRSCALPLAETDAERCVRCQLDPGPLDWCDAWGHYRGGLEPLLHAFKFARHDFLAEPLAALLGDVLARHADDAFDVLVPVPMSRAKKRRRGFNQAELLARSLSARTGIRCDPALMRKRVERQTQSRLARGERAANVRGVFVASRSVKGKAVLLVDDICTTGETLRASARELLRCGAQRVSAITLAKAS